MGLSTMTSFRYGSYYLVYYHTVYLKRSLQSILSIFRHHPSKRTTMIKQVACEYLTIASCELSDGRDQYQRVHPLVRDD